MARLIVIVAFAIILLAILTQLLAKYNVVSYKMRIGVGIALLGIAIGIGIFTYHQDKNEEHLTKLVQSFLQGEALLCQVGTQTLQASNKTFNFISGTLTLKGKEESNKHTIIPLKACDRKEP
ncbi:hypothetical protein LS70_007540 [Helicobacter sp. MIT 11-5569]|uniref:hypothetical protein n=1 Tax=Helicobacter sp. MIT 11-5569 TaxID=1548151 RepID=UPI00051FA77F|nr:hypothetical protein [Helicobacter sp. MIT 11-5569]TLD82446.1 hypothetical protein LS70_007540 [Helicobacter sp. MIT 11-5569]